MEIEADEVRFVLVSDFSINLSVCIRKQPIITMNITAIIAMIVKPAAILHFLLLKRRDTSFKSEKKLYRIFLFLKTATNI